MACWTAVYAVVQRFPTRTPIATKLPIDDVVPLVRDAIWLYMLPYAVAPCIAATLSPTTFRAVLRASWIAVAIGHAIFLVVPTVVLRPAFPPPTSFTERFHDVVAALDTPPGNAAPSLHVALAVLLAWAVAADHRRFAVPGAIFAAAIAASTLLLRQHHVIDVASGALVAVSALWAGRRAGARRPASP